MQTTLLLIIGFLVIAYFCATLVSHLDRLAQTLATVSAKTEQMAGQIDEMKEALESIEWRLLPEEEKQKRRFDRLPAFTLSDVRALKEGAVVPLASKSYHYPLDFPVFDQFEYKHAGIDDATPTEFGFEVRGFSRRAQSDNWEPYTFLAKADECTTSSCAGTIRRGRVE